MLLAAAGSLLIPLAPTGAPVVAALCLIGQQLVTDSAITVYDVTETSVRQARVDDRQLGRVASTFRVGAGLVQLVATIGAGVLAEIVGLRAVCFLAPLGGLIGALVLWRSPVVRLRELPTVPGAPSPTEVVVAVGRDEPIGG
jgi:MFS family permease